MPLILGTNSIKDTGYNVANSCRFNEADSPDLSRATGETTGATQWTFSAWIKRSTLGSLDNGGTFMGWYSATNKRSIFGFNDDDKLYWWSDNGSGTQGDATTAAVFRDVGAWYHVVLKIDTPQSDQANRVKIFVNNVEQTLTFSGSHPAQNEANTGMYGKSIIGASYYNTGTDRHFGGYLAEVCLIDDSALSPSSFAEADEDSPTIWKPKDVSGLTFGSDGAYLDFEDSGDLDDDESGNGNDYTATNLAATDQCVDSPTNNFATANPLNVNSGGVSTFAEGNTEVTVNGASGMQFGSSSTLGMTAGKWYCEVKIKTVDSGLIGVSAGASEDARDDYPPGTQGGAESVGILCSSGNRYIDDSGATHGAATSADGIMMIALDLDNNNVYFGTGGNWFDGSGNADESSPNSAISVTAVGSTTEGAYFFSFGDGGGSSACKVQWNFGNPPYANSSSQSDANGYGDFEYSVPSGYLALCTKNLGSDGG